MPLSSFIEILVCLVWGSFFLGGLSFIFCKGLFALVDIPFVNCMGLIVNKDQLLAGSENTNPIIRARKIILDSLEIGLDAVDPRKIILNKLSLDDSILKINDYSFDLTQYKKVFVVGGGKAAGSMAEALEQILGDHITAGSINVPYGSVCNTKIVKVNEASHPLPDQSSVDGTRKILAFAEEAEVDDLVIFLISGGGSSLMSYPIEGLTIEDKRQLTNELLRSGATINEVNAVRKHLSRFKGGLFAKAAYPASIVNLMLSDVVGDPLDVIASGPTVADSTTFRDAHYVLEKYDLWSKVPRSVQKVILDGEKNLIEDTPKSSDKIFEKVNNIILGNNRTSCLAVCQYLRSLGLKTLLLTSTVEGEAKYVGAFLSSMANEVVISGNPLERPVAIVLGGETTVRVTGKGVGGRNQELALSAATKIKNNSSIVIASMATDGIDGPTDAAGAIVDSTTCLLAKELGLEAKDYLLDNDSYHFFSRLGALIFTGQTGTNVNDLSIALIL